MSNCGVAFLLERIAAAIGLSDAGSGAETTFWAVRKFLEALARDWPELLPEYERLYKAL